jgi:CRP-like cAMP-binding protein
MAKLSISEIDIGMVLGEMVTLKDGSFLSRGVILNQSHLDRLSEADFTSIKMDQAEDVLALCQSAASRALPNLEHRIYHQGDYLFLQGQNSTEIFLLLGGALEVIYTPNSSLFECSDPKEALGLISLEGRRVAEMKRPMTVVGEMGPLLSQRRSTSIRARVSSHVAIIPANGQEFRNTLIHNSKLGLNIAVGLAQRMEESLDNITLFEVLTATLQDLFTKQPAKFQRAVEHIEAICESSPIVAFKVLGQDLKSSPLYRKFFRFQKPNTPSRDDQFGQSTGLKMELDLFPDPYLKEFDSGDLLCGPGDDADFIYILHCGRIGVFEEDSILLQFRDQGDTLGTVKALAGFKVKPPRKDHRTRTLKALTKSRILIIPIAEIETVAQKYPAVIVHVCRSLAARLTQSNQEMTNSLTALDEGIKKAYGAEDSILAGVRSAIELCDTVDPHRHLLSSPIQQLEMICTVIEAMRENYNELLVSVHSQSTLDGG